MNEAEWLALTEEPLSYGEALQWVEGPAFGAVVGFSGTVRDHAEGRTGVTAIEYEAYEDQVVPRLEEIARTARELYGTIGRIVIWHRVGHVPTGQSSVVIAVSAPHRSEAFDACRYMIDTLKQAVPIWKREHWPGGSDWSPAARTIEPVAVARPPGDGERREQAS